MSEPLARNYRCKDVEVLTTSSTIVLTAQDNLAAIIEKRPLWKDPFFPDLSKRIDNAFKQYLGVDNASDLRAKTTSLTGIATPAKNDLSEFKINISEDFKKNKPRLTEILKLLGYTDFWKAAENKDQEAIIQLLYAYQTNMTPALQTEITDEGTSPALISKLTGYATKLKDANVNQEFAKSQRPLTSAAAVTEFNAIYDQVSSVCKICRNIFKDNAALKDNFSFSAVTRRLNAEAAPAKPKATPASPK